ncbi:MAG: MFS transporter [Hyphomicrobiales bacterium]|nr:MFS transporter [Hyphomicrobiales bacterium]
MSSLSNLIPFFLAAGILLAGNGIQGTLITLRASQEGFEPTMIGLIGAGYFAGFAASCLTTPRLIRKVGHIRVFAALAAVAAAGTLSLLLWIEPLVWLVVRFTTGFCFAGLFTVMESWLNASSENADRGRVFSIYRFVDLTAVAGTQFLLPVFGAGGFELFALTAILFSISLVPVSLSDRSSPKLPEAFTFDLGQVWRISPLACTGCLALGLTNSAFRLIGPLYGELMGLGIAGVALFVSASIVGGAALQLPLGYLSDRFDRRWVILATTAGAAAAGLLLSGAGRDAPWLIYTGAFLFGAFALPLYSLSVAQANDHAEPGQYVLLAAGLIFFYAIGASCGPLVASIVIERFGPPAFFVYTSAVHAVLIVAALLRIVQRPAVPRPMRARFHALMRTSPVLVRQALKSGTLTRRPASAAPEHGRQTVGDDAAQSHDKVSRLRYTPDSCSS